tara:strand:+ start:10958 stop:11482 length:525 start_codon:yes stop_codon:yes gene_type:complete
MSNKRSLDNESDLDVDENTTRYLPTTTLKTYIGSKLCDVEIPNDSTLFDSFDYLSIDSINDHAKKRRGLKNTLTQSIIPGLIYEFDQTTCFFTLCKMPLNKWVLINCNDELPADVTDLLYLNHSPEPKSNINEYHVIASSFALHPTTDAMYLNITPKIGIETRNFCNKINAMFG